MAYTKILVIHNRLDKCLDYARDKEKTALSLAEAKPLAGDGLWLRYTARGKEKTAP